MRSAIALLCVAALACASDSAQNTLDPLILLSQTPSRQTKTKKTAATSKATKKKVTKKKTTATLYENEWLKLTCRVKSAQCQHLENSCPQGKYREQCMINKLTALLRTLRWNENTAKYCKAKGMKRTCSRLTHRCRRRRSDYRKAVCKYRIARRAHRRLLSRFKRQIRYKCYRTKACRSAQRTIKRRSRRSWYKIAKQPRKLQQTLKTCKGKNATCYINTFNKQLGWSSKKKSGKKPTPYIARVAARRTIKKRQSICYRQPKCKRLYIRYFNCKKSYRCRRGLSRSSYKCQKNAKCSTYFVKSIMNYLRCFSSRRCAYRLLRRF